MIWYYINVMVGVVFELIMFICRIYRGRNTFKVRSEGEVFIGSGMVFVCRFSGLLFMRLICDSGFLRLIDGFFFRLGSNFDLFVGYLR